MKMSMIGTYPDLQFDSLVLPEHCLHLKIDAYSGDEGRGEAIVSITEQEGSFTHTAVSYDQKFEHVVKVLVCRVLLPFTVIS